MSITWMSQNYFVFGVVIYSSIYGLDIVHDIEVITSHMLCKYIWIENKWLEPNSIWSFSYAIITSFFELRDIQGSTFIFSHLWWLKSS